MARACTAMRRQQDRAGRSVMGSRRGGGVTARTGLARQNPPHGYGLSLRAGEGTVAAGPFGRERGEAMWYLHGFTT
jgi:hypothetical protein